MSRTVEEQEQLPTNESQYNLGLRWSFGVVRLLILRCKDAPALKVDARLKVLFAAAAAAVIFPQGPIRNFPNKTIKVSLRLKIGRFVGGSVGAGGSDFIKGDRKFCVAFVAGPARRGPCTC